MKLAIAWFTTLVLVIAVSCSVNHRSGDYVCTKQSDCMSPRVCEEGFCIVPDSVPIDAPPGPPPTDAPMTMVDGKINPTPDAPADVCPPQCTSCDPNAHMCRIECGAANNNCSNEVVCPPGYSCDIGCNTAGACKNGIVCTDATACTISCGGTSSCKNIECGDGPCDITCSGPSSCHGVDCGSSCACDVACTGASSTGGPVCQNVICSALQCSDGAGCSSQNIDCNTCP